MKEKIIIFIIGLLLGAIISTGSIYFYSISNNTNNQLIQMPGGNSPSMQNQENGQPRELPDRNNRQENNQQNNQQNN